MYFAKTKNTLLNCQLSVVSGDCSTETATFMNIPRVQYGVAGARGDKPRNGYEQYVSVYCDRMEL